MRWQEFDRGWPDHESRRIRHGTSLERKIRDHWNVLILDLAYFLRILFYHFQPICWFYYIWIILLLMLLILRNKTVIFDSDPITGISSVFLFSSRCSSSRTLFFVLKFKFILKIVQEAGFRSLYILLT